MDIITILLIIITGVNTLLGVVLLFHAKKHSFSQLYAINILMIVFWSIGMIFFRFANQNNILTIAKSLYIAGSLIASTFLYFSFVFPDRTEPLSGRAWLLIALPNAAIIGLVAFSNLIVSSAEVIVGGENPIYFGPLYWVFGLFILTYFFTGFLVLTRKYWRFRHDRVQRLQIMYLLGSYAFAANIAFVTNLILPWFGYYTLQWLGQVTTVVMAIFTTIAVFKYRLFNIKVIVVELLTLLLLALILVRIIIAQTARERILELGIFIMAVFVGIFLIRAVLREVEHREQIERLAENLEAANARLKELDQMKSEFVSIASHQLRSPLTAIKGYASLVLEGSFGTVNEAVKEAVQKIFDSSSLMAVSVQDFLDVSRIEQGRMKYDFEVFDLRKLAETVVEELMPAAQAKRLEFGLKVVDASDYRINADLGKIKQVLHNLIDNSIKYTPKGSVEVALKKKDDKVLVEIRDTGVGIDAATLPKLFEKFVRSRNAHHVNVSGTGLGLFVVKEMVKAHNGKVWATSDGKGKGSVFHVELDEYRPTSPATTS